MCKIAILVIKETLKLIKLPKKYKISSFYRQKIDHLAALWNGEGGKVHEWNFLNYFSQKFTIIGKSKSAAWILFSWFRFLRGFSRKKCTVQWETFFGHELHRTFFPDYIWIAIPKVRLPIEFLNVGVAKACRGRCYWVTIFLWKPNL